MNEQMGACQNQQPALPSILERLDSFMKVQEMIITDLENKLNGLHFLAPQPDGRIKKEPDTLQAKDSRPITFIDTLSGRIDHLFDYNFKLDQIKRHLDSII